MTDTLQNAFENEARLDCGTTTFSKHVYALDIYALSNSKSSVGYSATSGVGYVWFDFEKGPIVLKVWNVQTKQPDEIASIIHEQLDQLNDPLERKKYLTELSQSVSPSIYNSFVVDVLLHRTADTSWVGPFDKRVKQQKPPVDSNTPDVFWMRKGMLLRELAWSWTNQSSDESVLKSLHSARIFLSNK